MTTEKTKPSRLKNHDFKVLSKKFCHIEMANIPLIHLVTHGYTLW